MSRSKPEQAGGRRLADQRALIIGIIAGLVVWLISLLILAAAGILGHMDVAQRIIVLILMATLIAVCAGYILVAIRLNHLNSIAATAREELRGYVREQSRLVFQVDWTENSSEHRREAYERLTRVVARR